MPDPRLVVCSHRGPYSYRRAAHGFASSRGGGGLINAITPVMEQLGGTWIAAAMSPVDHDVAREHPDGLEEAGFTLQLLDLPAREHDLHYDVVSNEHLWFLFHYLFDIPSQPVFDDAFAQAWHGYVAVNQAYAEAVRKVGSADVILVEDYHLMRVGAELREAGVDAPLLYFHHTPWCDAEYLSIVPDGLRREILEGLLAHDVVGFHARRWADNFARSCEQHLGASASTDEITYQGRTSRLVVAPVPIDIPRLRAEAASERTERWVETLTEMAHGRKLIVRVDRIDLSKNPLRGFLAFERLLERRPELANDVLFLALQYPSRLRVDAYRRYFAACLEVVQRINDRFGEKAPGEEGPLQLHFQDDFNQSLAGLRLYDALLVNPVFDGLNLVSKEGALINERDGSVLLSRNAGAYEELKDSVLAVDPFDIEGTADALEAAMEMGAGDRADRAARTRAAASAGTPEAWIRSRLGAAGVGL